MPTVMKLPPKTEFKTFPFELKSVDEDQGIVTGYLSTFNNVDSQGDKVLRGAFRKTLSEAKSRMENGRRFLIPALWMHNPEEPIGGVVDASEDDHGLLVTVKLDISTNEQGIPNNPRATMVFSGFKVGYSDEMSMGYNAIQKEYENGVRNLKECRLVECSAVTMLFAANPEAIVPASGVKSMNVDTTEEIEEKTVCGNTSGPIGPRDEGWSGSAAEKWIWSKALDEDGKVKSAIAKKYFMKLDGDPTLKGSYGYPFWVDDHISVGGVKACANALAGARNADAGEDTVGMRRKVETLYGRINSKYPDADKLVPPWKSDDGKANGNSVDRKTYEEHFAEHMCSDLLNDWEDVYICALTHSIMDALKIGDEPEIDISEAIDGFKQQVMTMFVPQAKQYGLSQYLADNSSGPSLSDGGGYGMGYMSQHSKPDAKAGRRFSADTKKTLQQHADELQAMADEHKTMSDQLAAQYKSSMKAMKAHADALEQKASDLTDLWQSEGQGPAYAEDTTDSGNNGNGEKSNSHAESTKRREPPAQALTRNQNTQPVTTTEEDEIKALEAALAGWAKK